MVNLICGKPDAIVRRRSVVRFGIVSLPKSLFARTAIANCIRKFRRESDRSRGRVEKKSLLRTQGGGVAHYGELFRILIVEH